MKTVTVKNPNANSNSYNCGSASCSICVSDAEFVEVPVVPHLHQKVLAVIESGKGKLDMGRWHTCKTTHCRAGWIVALAGAAGKKLEKELGDCGQAANLILAESAVPELVNFYVSNKSAMDGIKRCAAIEASLELDGT